jgi:DNA (cytosine-5)-methyltransferase 1
VTGQLYSVELCAGGGGTFLGLEQAGFRCGAAVEIDHDACETLRRNRSDLRVIEADIARVDGSRVRGIALVSGGLPCTPFSRGGKQLGRDDERDLWPRALQIVADAVPRAVLFETAKEILSAKFDDDRAQALAVLHGLGYSTWWAVADASRYGVPQVRRRAILIALREPEAAAAFAWPEPLPGPPPAVGDTLYDLVAANGWAGAEAWRDGAQGTAPVIVGGSKKHGGADLGASQSKAAWRKLGIDPMGIADSAPGPDGKYKRGAGKVFDAGETGLMLTVRMTARIQAFPDSWEFAGGKTSAYRQIGNALPPPVARTFGAAIRAALEAVP